MRSLVILGTLLLAPAARLAFQPHTSGISRPSRFRSRGKTQMSDAYSMENVAKLLKADIRSMFCKELPWETFAEDFKLVDHTGANFEGLESNKLRFELLRRLHAQFAVKDSIRVNSSIQDNAWDADASLFTEWKIEVGDGEINNVPLAIQARTCWEIDSKHQVRCLRICECLVNGLQFEFWPELNLFDDDASTLKKIKEWVQSIQELQSTSTIRPMDQQPFHVQESFEDDSWQEEVNSRASLEADEQPLHIQKNKRNSRPQELRSRGGLQADALSGALLNRREFNAGLGVIFLGAMLMGANPDNIKFPGASTVYRNGASWLERFSLAEPFRPFTIARWANARLWMT